MKGIAASYQNEMSSGQRCKRREMTVSTLLRTMKTEKTGIWGVEHEDPNIDG